MSELNLYLQINIIYTLTFELNRLFFIAKIGAYGL